MESNDSIRNVSDTAVWVAIYRAMESERKDAIFRDPYARRLGGERGEAIVRSMPGGAATAWPMIVRTAVMDEIVLRCVRAGVRTVLDTAAGLDARPFRLELPAELRWIHADMAPMVEYFSECMAGETPRCRLEYAAVDLREQGPRRELFDRAGGEGPILVITEGLLLYLPEPAVVALARDQHDRVRARWWLTDLASPRLLRMLARRWAPGGLAANAPFVFGPAEGSAWFAGFGWRELEWRSSFGESLRLDRTLRGGAWFWKLLDRMQPRARRAAGHRMSGILLLGNTDEVEATRP
ncbi:MAG: class I SAM-dependent methyltransferase [Arenimonas sp.]